MARLNKDYTQCDPEVGLMVQVQQGDAAAFQELVRR